jgi:hypothetical protein
VLAVRWYLRYGLSYRDLEQLLAERGIDVDHLTVYRWVQRFTPLLADAARFVRHAPGERWFVDETCVKVNGVWRYVYRCRPARAGHRRPRVEASRRARRPTVLHTCAGHVDGDAVRGGHRCCACLFAGARRAGAGRVASRRKMGQQSDRVFARLIFGGLVMAVNAEVRSRTVDRVQTPTYSILVDGSAMRSADPAQSGRTRRRGRRPGHTPRYRQVRLDRYPRPSPALVAQGIEQRFPKPCVGSSNLPGGTRSES